MFRLASPLWLSLTLECLVPAWSMREVDLTVVRRPHSHIDLGDPAKGAHGLTGPSALGAPCPVSFPSSKAQGETDQDAPDNDAPDNNAAVEEVDLLSKADKGANSAEYYRQKNAEARDGLLVTSMLIGAVIFDMTMLYLMNSRDPQVKAYTYKMLSTGIVVFCALMVENMQGTLMHKVALNVAGLLNQLVYGMPMDNKMSLAGRILEGGMIVLVFLMWFFIMTWSSWKYRKHREDQYFFLSFVAHISAFSLLDYLGEIQEHMAVHTLYVEHHSGRGHKEVGYNISVIAMYTLMPVVVTLLYLAGSRAMHLCIDRFFCEALDEGHEPPAAGHHVEEPGDASSASHAQDSHTHGAAAADAAAGGGTSQTGEMAENVDHQNSQHLHEHHDWKHEAVHAECDSMAILVGFLIKQFITYMVTARPVPMECAKYPVKCRADAYTIIPMLFVVLFLYLIVVPVSVWHANARSCPTWILRFELVLCMTLSWVVLQLSEWATVGLVMDHSDEDSPLRAKTVKKLICASALSPLFLTVIVYIDALADWGLIDGVSAEVTVQCIAFLIGFYWEKVFMSAIRNITKWLKYTEVLGLGSASGVLLSVGLLCIIMPAWRWYLIPTACQPVPRREADQLTTWKIFNKAVTKVRQKLRFGSSLKDTPQQAPATPPPLDPSAEPRKADTSPKGES